MKIVMKIINIALVLILALTITTFAENVGGVNVNPDTSAAGATTATKVGDQVVGIIKVVGIFVSIGAIMVIGVKYMMGSAEEKAEYKKVLIPYLIGAVLLFAASAFATQIYNLAQNLFNSGATT